MSEINDVSRLWSHEARMVGAPLAQFGIAWVVFALAIAAHVTDEATHDFLGVYNPSVRAIRARLPFVPLPTFSFRVWIGLLSAGIILLFCLAPLAFGQARWLRVMAIGLALVVGVGNAALHLAGSAYLRRWLPGVLSSPLLLAAGLYLLATAVGR